MVDMFKWNVNFLSLEKVILFTLQKKNEGPIRKPYVLHLCTTIFILNMEKISVG